MQINERKKTFICFHLFFRIWTFQSVTSEKIKNLTRVSTRVAGCEQTRFPDSRWRPQPKALCPELLQLSDHQVILAYDANLHKELFNGGLLEARPRRSP
jgi:hypothetical protein